MTGGWHGPVPLPPRRDLRSLVTFLDGDDKELFLDLLAGLLHWLPEQRLSAAEVYFHPWLRKRS